jgi:SsrA-binding protein
LKKKDILYLSQKLKEKGFSLIPEEVYLKWNLIKVKVSLVKWKKKFEKKQILKEKSIDKQAKIESSRLFR